MKAYLAQFFGAFLRTEIIEISALFLLIKNFVQEKKKFSNFQILFVGFLASFATLPYLWLVIPYYINLHQWILLVELVIVLVEALIYWQFLGIKYKYSLLISLVCNSLSYFLGKLLFLIIK